MAKTFNHGRIVSSTEKMCLDSAQLNSLEKSFRHWADSASRTDIRLARRRILLVFLLIRYTGAKLSEVLALNLDTDIDFTHHFVTFPATPTVAGSLPREIHIAKKLCREIREISASYPENRQESSLLSIDPGFVRRKFYERAEACSFAKKMGGPEMIRKARAVELLRANMPLPAVQMMLGHSTPNLTSSYVSFSQEEIRRITGIFLHRESIRQTSARNSFFGKIVTVEQGTIQTRVVLQTLNGLQITTVITRDSLEKLGLSPGALITAEVKAPSVMLHCGKQKPFCSAENVLKGLISKITQGKVNSEYLVKIDETTEICAIVSTARSRDLNLKTGEQVWTLFNCFAVVLHAE
ncbi:MAG: TOBE domain-containing protein [Desulfopila sp.]|jgi:molybdate transport system regulatory protein|nr:TOBE domain-containing protein [Desulfopila sp.]